MSTKELIELIILLVFVMIYPMLPLNYIMPRWGGTYALLALNVPYTLLIVWMTFRLERRRIRNEQ